MSNRTLGLLGDSILDNASYAQPAPDTAAHLGELLGGEWLIRLLAEDGARMADMSRQLSRLSAVLDTAVLSIGGNDVTSHIGLLGRRDMSAPETLGQLLAIADEFERAYVAVARRVAQAARRTILCTIYEVRLEPEPLAMLARVPLAVLNDRIVRVGARLGLDVLELRTVCTERGDFVLQIEPSASGAAKIARAIAGVVGVPPGLRAARVFSTEDQ
jgi:lysophospholipase L1-like esterase